MFTSISLVSVMLSGSLNLWNFENSKNIIRSLLVSVLSLSVVWLGVVNNSFSLEQIFVGGVAFFFLKNSFISKTTIFSYPLEIISFFLIIDINELKYSGIVLFLFYVFKSRAFGTHFTSLLIALLGFLNTLNLLDENLMLASLFFCTFFLLKYELAKSDINLGLVIRVFMLSYLMLSSVSSEISLVPSWLPCFSVALLMVHYRSTAEKRNLLYMVFVLSTFIMFNQKVPFLLGILLSSIVMNIDSIEIRESLRKFTILSDVILVLLPTYFICVIPSTDLGIKLILPALCYFLLLFCLKTTKAHSQNGYVGISLAVAVILGFSWGHFL